MCPFVESLRIENGVIHNLHYHNERMNRTRQELFGRTDEINLASCIPAADYKELTKCRVIYKEDIQDIEFAPYQMRTIQSLQMVVCNEIDYHYKSSDRQLLNCLFGQKGECDDILIIKDGYITDTSAANVALYDGQTWYTPSTPLLPGTNRAFLLDQGLIQEKEITPADLPSYQKIALFNAMIDFGRIVLPVSAINPYFAGSPTITL